MSPEKDRILVIGGTGMLGAPVVRALYNNSHTVRVLSRDLSKARAMFQNDDIEIVGGDLDDPASIQSAMRNCRGVHINLMGGPTKENFEKVEHQGAAMIARLAEKQKLRQLTYLSGAPVDPQNFHDHGTRAKLLAEQAIKDSGVPYVIFRATWMMESLMLFIKGKSAIVIGTQAHKLRWIAADDYAAAVANSYSMPKAINKIFYLFGPQALSKPEALQIYIRLVNPQLRLRFLPLPLMKVIAQLSFNKTLRADVMRMAYYDNIGDDYGSGAEADAMFGPSTTTLEAWCLARSRLITGK